MPLGPLQLGIILLAVVIIFGVGKLPEVGGALGKGIREFKDEGGFNLDGEPKADSDTKEKEETTKSLPAPERTSERSPTGSSVRADDI